MDVGSRIVSPASVATSIPQGTIKAFAGVTVSQALADKNSTTIVTPKKDLFAKSHSIAHAGIAKFVGTTHPSELTQPDQATAVGIAACLAAQRAPVTIVTALLAEAKAAT